MKTPAKSLYPPAISPCMGCADRELGCHGRCDKYQAFKDSRIETCREIKARARQERMINNERVNAAIRRKERINKGR